LGLSENLASALGEMVDAMELNFRSSVAIARAIHQTEMLADTNSGTGAPETSPSPLTRLCSPKIFRRAMEKGEPGVAPILT
jgi:hypothetical protein